MLDNKKNVNIYKPLARLSSKTFTFYYYYL